MDKLDRRLAQLFKRTHADDTGLENMPAEYIRGWYDGAVANRDAQRASDIQVAKKILSPH